MTVSHKKNHKRKLLLLLIPAVGLLCILILAVAWHSGNNKSLDPDETVTKPESRAEAMGDEGDGKLEQEGGGGATSLTYADKVTVDLNMGKLKLLLGNPSRANYNAVVQVVLQDEVIGISGRLEPGYQVRELSLDKKLKLSPGEYEGKLQVYFYDPATDERAMVNASIPVSITVKKR